MAKKKVTKAESAKKSGARRPPAKSAGATPTRKPSRPAASRKPAPVVEAAKPAQRPAATAGKTAARPSSKPPVRPPATAEQVEGARPVKAVKPPSRKIPAGELAKIRELLAHKKRALSSHLQTELSELEKPEKRHRADLEEIASDTHDTDSLCEIMDIEASQIDQIDMALTKIDNGTYGVCEDCGGEIPLARLEALPFASQCIECKRKAEISGRIAAPPDSAAFL